jgi:hypothetical protein
MHSMIDEWTARSTSTTHAPIHRHLLFMKLWQQVRSGQDKMQTTSSKPCGESHQLSHTLAAAGTRDSALSVLNERSVHLGRLHSPIFLVPSSGGFSFFFSGLGSTRELGL